MNPRPSWVRPVPPGVWAEENTREAIFDAMKRKETYGTSGTLIRLRFFGGWEVFEESRQGQELRQKGLQGRCAHG